MNVEWIGSIGYSEAWDLQRELAARRLAGEIPDTLLLLEHPPILTMGRAASLDNLLAGPDALLEAGVSVMETDRGGDVTYHGPGQLVGYPIFDLRQHSKDVHLFLRSVEEALILALAEFGLTGRRFPPHTGVWIEDRKIAAIGIKVSRWITTHGFALNVSPQMDHFDLIVPCGIREFGVTSMARELDRPIEVVELLPFVITAFQTVFYKGTSVVTERAVAV